MKVTSAIACIVTTFILSACLLPEKFSATVAIHPDASYDYRYAGTVVNVFAVAEIKQLGAMSAKSEAALKAEADKLAKVPDVRRASYLGGGRYDLIIEGRKLAGEKLNLLNILTVNRDREGVITISSPELKSKDQQALATLGAKINGTLDIRLPRNAEVISHNATSTPIFFGLIGSYSWKIGGTDQRPVIKIRLKV